MSPLSAPLLLPRVMLEYETGQSAQGEGYLERLLEVMRRGGIGASVKVSMAITTIVRITGVPGRLEIAEAAAEEVLSQQPVTPYIAMDAKPCWPCRRATRLRRRNIMLIYRGSEAR